MSGYKGKVSNGSAQRVKAPCGNSGKAKGTRVVRGGDLRTGKKR